MKGYQGRRPVLRQVFGKVDSVKMKNIDVFRLKGFCDGVAHGGASGRAGALVESTLLTGYSYQFACDLRALHGDNDRAMPSFHSRPLHLSLHLFGSSHRIGAYRSKWISHAENRQLQNSPSSPRLFIALAANSQKSLPVIPQPRCS